jgi:hypothetical protein
MSLIIGPQTASDGQAVLARAEKSGAAVIQSLHGRHYEVTKRGACFGGAIVGQVTTVGLATTYTGLVLSNPITSSVDLVVLKAGWSAIVAFAAGAHVGLMAGYNASTNVTHTTPVTVRSNRFTGVTGTGAGLLDSAATLPTAPTVHTMFGSGLTGAITTTPFIGSTLENIDGGIILPAGAYLAFYTSTASGTAGMGFSFMWEEVAA